MNFWTKPRMAKYFFPSTYYFSNFMLGAVGGKCLVFVLEDDSHTSFLVAGKPFFIGPICLQSELHIVNVE